MYKYKLQGLPLHPFKTNEVYVQGSCEGNYLGDLALCGSKDDDGYFA